ncbi:LOW QUALITY PROTEIN: probable LAGLIDADG homing endonuclease (mitochondrion) [Coccomyxa sp. Obi]|nr:LOW QUALITY PROTEIN: probable LAGLIDADG homing endonuclease [Coccomyxa sp. Obi]
MQDEKGRSNFSYLRKEEIGKSRNLLKRYKQQLDCLSKEQKDVAIGVMLGDGSLQTQNGGKSYRLKLLQGGKNREYLFHLCDVFSEWVLSPPSPQHRKSVATGKVLEAWRAQTISHPAFNELAEIFLDEKGRKILPTTLVRDHLTRVALHTGLMDDGGRSNYNKDRPELKGITINTQGFTEAEVHSLASGLKLYFRLDCWVGRNKGRWTIIISGLSFQHLAKMIGPYIHPSMGTSSQRVWR